MTATQKTLEPQRLPSEDDQFEDSAEDVVAEVDNSRSSLSIVRRPLCNLRFADDIDSLKDGRKQLLDMV